MFLLTFAFAFTFILTFAFAFNHTLWDGYVALAHY